MVSSRNLSFWREGNPILSFEGGEKSNFEFGNPNLSLEGGVNPNWSFGAGESKFGLLNSKLDFPLPQNLNLDSPKTQISVRNRLAILLNW